MSAPLRQKIYNLKLVLFGLAAGLTLLLFLLPGKNESRINLVDIEEENLQPSQTEEQASNLRPDAGDVAATTMLSPRFSGADDKNRAWEIKADQAQQAGSITQQHVSLTSITASATTPKGELLKFKAGHGYFNQKDQSLLLSGKVVMEGYGLRLETEKMQGNMETLAASSTTPVIVEGQGSHLEGKNFELMDQGNKIRLHGGVKGRFNVTK